MQFCGGFAHRLLRLPRNCHPIPRNERKLPLVCFFTAAFFRNCEFSGAQSTVCRRHSAGAWPERQFRLSGTHRASARLCFVIIFRHINKGGTCRGPILAPGCAGCVRRVFVCRRGSARCILTHDPEKCVAVFGQGHAVKKVQGFGDDAKLDQITSRFLTGRNQNTGANLFRCFFILRRHDARRRLRIIIQVRRQPAFGLSASSPCAWRSPRPDRARSSDAEIMALGWLK